MVKLAGGRKEFFNIFVFENNLIEIIFIVNSIKSTSS